MTVEVSTNTSAGVGHETGEDAEFNGNPVRDNCITHSRRSMRHKCRSLSELSRQLEEGVVAKEWMLSTLDGAVPGKKGRMTYCDMKSIIERRLAYQKRGFLSEEEIRNSVTEFRNLRSETELDPVVVRDEIERFNRRMKQYSNDPVGNMSEDKEVGRVRFLFCQTNNMSTKQVREVKIKGIQYLERKYDTDATFLNEHGCNLMFAPRGDSLERWMGDEGRARSVMAFNTNDSEVVKSMH